MCTRFIVLFICLFQFLIIAKPVVYIVKHQDLPAYNIAIDTIKEELSSEYDLKEATVDRQNIAQLAKEIKKHGQSLPLL